MPKLTEPVRRRRRLQIAEAAVRCFARKGVAGTSMADIIAESGLSTGSIYSHFESKAELMRFTAATVMEARGADLLTSVEDGPVLDPGQLMFRMVNDTLPVEMRHVLIQVFAEAPLDPELAVVTTEIIQRVTGLLGQVLMPWARSVAAPGVTEAELEEHTTRVGSVVLANLHGYLVRTAIDPSSLTNGLLEDLAEALSSAYRA